MRVPAMTKIAAVAICTALAILSPSQRVCAHIRSETYSSWVINGSSIYLTFTVPRIEAQRIASPGQATPGARELGAYLGRHLVATAAGKPCPAVGLPEEVSATSGYRRFEFNFECSTTAAMTIGSSAFFELVPAHVNLAQIQTSDGQFIDQLLTEDRQTLELSGEGAESRLQSAGFLEYVLMGVMHIFTGFDHQAFLIGLVLISRRVRDLALAITGFTLGHSTTLALAVTGVVRPHAQYIDALVALTIALIGAENIAVATQRPRAVIAAGTVILAGMLAAKLAGLPMLPATLLIGAGLFSASYLQISNHLEDAARLRVVVTVVFGLIHGFGFASNLLEMRLPTGRLAQLLVGFNLGVEVGQLTVVLAVLGIVWMLVRLRLALPRPIVVDVSASMLVGLGLYWFVSRSFIA
jgi:hypothetical protein